MSVIVFIFALLGLHAFEIEIRESGHFVFKLAPRDLVLEEGAKEALEACAQEAERLFGIKSATKTTVQVYGGVKTFSKNSLLEEELIKRGGIVGLAKFDRLMILTPEALPYGYSWQDTLCHEYLHHLLKDEVSESLPLWFQEGFARYFEGIWQGQEGFVPLPGDEEEFYLAAREDRLIGFSQMEPSLVYLKDSRQIALAFTEVAFSLREMRGKIAGFLEEIAQGADFQKAFKKIYGKKLGDFEKRLFSSWTQKAQKAKDLKPTGAMRSALVFASVQESEKIFLGPSVENLVSLGDKLRLRGDLSGARGLYLNALKEEPHNPHVLSRLVRASLGLNDVDQAKIYIQTLVKQNPHWAPGYELLGVLYERQGRYQEALEAYKNYLKYNPYHKELYKRIAFLYLDLDERQKARRFFDQALILDPQDEEILKAKAAIRE